MSSLYNFRKNRIEITTSNTSSIIVNLFLATESFVDSAATVCFLEVYTFSFSYPWTRLLNTHRWFVSTYRISVATCLPFCFLETPICHNIYHLSQHKEICILPTAFVRVFHVILRISNGYFPKER
jgi:hypothetical protein